MKTITYVDGYNLYYGCLKHTADKWLDLKKLFHGHILKAQNPKAHPTEIKYFTADIRTKVASQGVVAQHAQQSYHRALRALYPRELQIIKGYYTLERAHLPRFRKPPDKDDRVAVWKLEEKQTDVNIAIEAYRDVAKGLAEQLVFVTNDTDIEPALAAIREDFGSSVAIGVVIPTRKGKERRPGNEALSRHANWTRRYITDKELRDSHLPTRIATQRKPIVKPEYW